MRLLDRISNRQIAAAAAIVVYAGILLTQPRTSAPTLFLLALAATALLLFPRRRSMLRFQGTTLALAVFLALHFNRRAIFFGVAVFVWVTLSEMLVARLVRRGRGEVATISGSIADFWLVAVLTLLTLEGYIVTGLLLISAASWLPRAGRMKYWFALAFALLGGWLIIAAKLDFDLELRRWYLLGALAIGITASLFASAQKVQQREDIDPQ